MAELRVPDMDFSGLANLGKTYQEAQQKAVRQRTLAELGQGTGPLDYDMAARKLLAVGDREGALSLAQLGNNNRDFQFRQQEAQRAQQNADRGYGLQERTLTATLEGQKVPPGFTRQADGTLKPMAGGPTDPAYIHATTEAKDKGKSMSITDITKLSEEGGKFASLKGFQDKFQDKFAGYKMPMVGNAAMAAGRYLPEAVVGKDTTEAATFWQEYDRYKNVVRNELFGAALTAPEQAAFEKGDIGPGMDPAQIRKNLAMQKAIVENGLKRKAAAMISNGYKPEAIGAAYGVDVGPAAGKPAVAPAAAPARPAATPQISEGATATNPQTGQKIMFRGGQWVPAQ
jgi:hypothetical protein